MGYEANGKQAMLRSTGMGKNTSVLMLHFAREREREKDGLVPFDSIRVCFLTLSLLQQADLQNDDKFLSSC